MPELHTRLLADVITLGSPYPLVLTGGYAVRAHRLVNRPSQYGPVLAEEDVIGTEVRTSTSPDGTSTSGSPRHRHRARRGHRHPDRRVPVLSEANPPGDTVTVGPHEGAPGKTASAELGLA
ncbi:hypothetical protein ABZ733_36035 [Streptomyces longwoodensis]|uniref:hypothetical protein n=1 Tax=Streptomyces longwoodensis TaxID=68231 RepID=UPI0033DAF8C4